MIILNSKTIWRWIGSIVLTVSYASAEIEPPKSFSPTLIGTDVIRDLESRSLSLTRTLEMLSAEVTGNEDEAEMKQAYSVNAKALLMISRALENREVLIGGAVIAPTEPFHRVNYEYNCASSDLQVALVWWIYCKSENYRRSIGSWEKLDLWTRLFDRFKKAEGALDALNLKTETDDAVGIIPLAPVITNRLASSGEGRGSILDKVATWGQLTDEEKSLIIKR